MIAEKTGLHRPRLSDIFLSDKWLRRFSLHPFAVGFGHYGVCYLHIGQSMWCRKFEVACGFGAVADAEPGMIRWSFYFAVRPAEWFPRLIWAYGYGYLHQDTDQLVFSEAWTGRGRWRCVGYIWRGRSQMFAA